MSRGKSPMTVFGESSPRLPIEPVGHDTRACKAERRSGLETGCFWTKDVSAASPKTEGAICRQASQSMQVESTKKSPGTFSGTRSLGFAICHCLQQGVYPNSTPMELDGEAFLSQPTPVQRRIPSRAGA